MKNHSSTILIVEDEAVSRSALSMLLSAYGYRTCPVGSGEEALRLFSLPDSLHLPIIALLDLDLPGMNGLELLERLRASHPEIPAVIITAAGRERVREIAERGIPHLRKPLDFRHLLTLLSEQKLPH